MRSSKGFKRIYTSKILLTIFSFLAVILLLLGAMNIPSNSIEADNTATRGVAGDLWADKILGKRDFGEISPRKVVPDKVSSPGGVVVDRSTSPGRAYIWDSGNSRIIGIDLDNCYNQDINERCKGEIVIGQPSLTDYGSCNQDSSFQFYPNKASASASTLCGIPEWTQSTLEDKSFTNMYVHTNGDLYVADVLNHRVLKFISPFTTDTIADEVWGQTDFTGNLCNQGGGYRQSNVNPTASTLCFMSNAGTGAGVSLDANGNLWVADGGNNRVLRFPNNSGVISKTADIVIGRQNFTTGGDTPGSAGLNRLKEPTSIAFDNSENLYIADSGNNRIMKFSPPFVSQNMSGTIFLDQSNFPNSSSVVSIQMDHTKNNIWIAAGKDFDMYINKYDLNGTPQLEPFTYWNLGGGSLGIDAEENILLATYVYGQDIIKYVPDIENNTYVMERGFFQPPGGYNLTSENRFEQGGWGGMGLLSNGQLIVTDGRLMFWNNPIDLPNGANPDGYIGGLSGVDLSPKYGILAVDKQDRIYIQKDDKTIEIFQGPLTNDSTPITSLIAPFEALGGGEVSILNTFGGVAVSKNGEYLWISDPDNSKVIRIRNPLTDPLVDVVLGQDSIEGNLCNRGVIQPPNVNVNSDASLDMLCNPGALSIDKFDNLYVSDHFFEVNGNWRLLMFESSTFEEEPENIIFSPDASKEFPRYGRFNSTQPHATFEVAFNSRNTMVISHNPYIGPRFLEYYDQPHQYNLSNPSDPQYAIPAGQLEDFYGWAFSLKFDSNDNLYVYDTNRGNVKIYLQPFGPVSPPTIESITSIPSTTTDSTPNFVFHSTNSGIITYGGSCSSSTTTAVIGNNTIKLNHLPDGTYSNCTITVTDNDSYISNTLNIPTFTITARSAMLKLKGDFNFSGRVDLSDLSILASYWNQSNNIADANNDNLTNLSDLSILAQNWLKSF